MSLSEDANSFVDLRVEVFLPPINKDFAGILFTMYHHMRCLTHVNYNDTRKLRIINCLAGEMTHVHALFFDVADALAGGMSL